MISPAPPHHLTLALLEERFAVCQLPSGEKIPAWATAGSLFSVTQTATELSIVCEAAQVPADVKRETGWRCLRVEGTLDFSLTGVLASLVAPLADARISVFTLSTFDTDYLLIKEEHLAAALHTLRACGHHIERRGEEEVQSLESEV